MVVDLKDLAFPGGIQILCFTCLHELEWAGDNLSG